MQGTALRRALATVVMAGTLLVSSAGVASAENWSLADPKGDVATTAEDDPAPVPAPNRRAGDVWRTSVSHTSTTVVVRVTLQAIPSLDWTTTAQIRTTRASFNLAHYRYGGHPGLSLTRTYGKGIEIRCGGKSSRIIGTALVLTVPRACIGRPGSVRVGVRVAVSDFGRELTHADDALRRSLGESLRLSPLIRRG